MLRKILWWIFEIVVWYLFFYVLVYAIEFSMDVGRAAFLLVFLSSLGIFANPVTRQLSFWNKVADEVKRKEEAGKEF